MPPRHVVWFSCGAPSACLAEIVCGAGLENVAVVYCDTSKNEHPDNARFLLEVQAWIGHDITVLRSEKYATVEEVFDARSYMSGRLGAPCTVEMKKKVRFAFQRPDDIHYFGYTSDERKGRRERFVQNNPELDLRWPLVERGITRADCFQMLQDADIALPQMYHLGYKNNNCIGCVKAGSPAYWHRIRRDFPAVFAQRVEQSRRIGCKLLFVKGVHMYLDELPAEPAVLRPVTEDISCGPECRGGA